MYFRKVTFKQQMLIGFLKRDCLNKPKLHETFCLIVKRPNHHCNGEDLSPSSIYPPFEKVLFCLFEQQIIYLKRHELELKTVPCVPTNKQLGSHSEKKCIFKTRQSLTNPGKYNNSMRTVPEFIMSRGKDCLRD